MGFLCNMILATSPTLKIKSKMASEKNLVDLVSQLKAIPTDPESYFQPTKELPKDTLSSLKGLFDFSRQYERSSGNGLCPLKELMVDGFDDEQIWQQVELQNEPVITDTKKRVRDVRKTGLKLRLVTSDIQNGHHDESDGDDDDDDGDDGHFGVEFEDFVDEDDVLGSSKFDNRVMMPASSSEDEEDDKIMAQVVNDDEIYGSDEIDDDDDSENDDDNKQRARKQGKKGEKQKKRGKSSSIVDDKFFKLSEMTEFLDKMDQDFERKQNAKQDDDDDDEIDYFMGN